MDTPVAEQSWKPLSPRERRVLGVLIEKAKTTPESYPMTVSAIVAGCNQKSNRDPVTHYDAFDVDETLNDLRHKGVVVRVEGGGRVQRWKHLAYDWLKVSKAELAVLAELLLRGPQTEGELRARASRMENLPDLSALQVVLRPLAERGLVVYLSPPGQKRGVVVTHGLYPPEELEELRRTLARGPSEPEGEAFRPLRAEGPDAGPAPPPANWATEVAALRDEVEELREMVAALHLDVQMLKSHLGS